MTDSFRLVLPNGLVLQGNYEDVVQAAKSLGHGNIVDSTKYHYSESKGEYILITDMATPYIANCIQKIWRVKSPHFSITASDLAQRLTNPHLLALLNEYSKRTDK